MPKGTRVGRCIEYLKHKYGYGPAIGICQKSTKQNYMTGKKMRKKTKKKGGGKHKTRKRIGGKWSKKYKRNIKCKKRKTKRRRKNKKGGNLKSNLNTKNLAIKTTIENFSKFKIFLKKLSNLKNINKESVQYLNKLDKKELKEFLNIFPNSEYEKAMKIIKKNKILRGGSIVDKKDIDTECKKNTDTGNEGKDPITSGDLGVGLNGRSQETGLPSKIMKDDSFENDAFCYNETTICDEDTGYIRNNMSKEPYLRRDWSSGFLNELACKKANYEEEGDEEWEQFISREGNDDLTRLVREMREITAQHRIQELLRESEIEIHRIVARQTALQQLIRENEEEPGATDLLDEIGLTTVITGSVAVLIVSFFVERLSSFL